LPRLYAIADVAVIRAHGVGLVEFAESLRDAGVCLVQLRHKEGSPQEILASAQMLREVFAGSNCRLIMNDRVDLAALAEFDGVHVGQEDLSPEDAKTVVLGTMPTLATMEPSRRWGTEFAVGVSTHNEAQVREADTSAADYVAIGPVFATGTKTDAEPVVGLEGVRRAHALTAKPLVAIGGITRENCRSVIDAGADSVAVISALLVPGETPGNVARDFLRILR
jgi:thiamine-phosphate pyrophosphorylase